MRRLSASLDCAVINNVKFNMKAEGFTSFLSEVSISKNKSNDKRVTTLFIIAFIFVLVNGLGKNLIMWGVIYVV